MGGAPCPCRLLITSMNLIAHNKKFRHFTAGASGSTDSSWLLKYSALFKDIQSGCGIPNKSMILGNFGQIPLINIGHTAFPRLDWLLKCFNENTCDLKEWYYNKRLCSARVVTQNAYGMLAKGESFKPVQMKDKKGFKGLKLKRFKFFQPFFTSCEQYYFCPKTLKHLCFKCLRQVFKNQIFLIF